MCCSHFFHFFGRRCDCLFVCLLLFFFSSFSAVKSFINIDNMLGGFSLLRSIGRLFVCLVFFLLFTAVKSFININNVLSRFDGKVVYTLRWKTPLCTGRVSRMFRLDVFVSQTMFWGCLSDMFPAAPQAWDCASCARQNIHQYRNGA